MTFPNVTYAGERFLETFGPVVLDPSELTDNELATIVDRTKFKSVINEMDDTVELQDPSAKFNSQTSTDKVDELQLETIPYEFHKEITLDTIRKSWYSGELGAGSLEDYQWDQLVDMFVQNVYIPKLKLAQANLVLNGKSGLNTDVGTYSFSATYNGLYQLLDSSGSVRKLKLSQYSITIASVTKGTTTVLTLASGTTATSKLFPGNVITISNAAGTGWSALNTSVEILSVNSDTEIEVDIDTDALTSNDYTGDSAELTYINRKNIIPVMASHLGFVPAAIRRQGAKIVMPTHLEMEWQFANAEAQENGGQYYMTAYQMQMINQNVVVLETAPANTLATWHKDHVFYGYDLSDDFANVEVLWQGQTGNKVYNLRAAMKTGVELTKLFTNKITYTHPDLS